MVPEQPQGQPASQFIGEEFQGSFQNGTSFRDIVMSQLRRIAELGSKELRGGYFEERPRGNVIERTYIADSKEEYSNAISVLDNLLLPHLDEEAAKELEQIKQKQKEALKKRSADSSDYAVFRSSVKLNHSVAMFRCLSKFLKRIDYFSEMGGEV